MSITIGPIVPPSRFRLGDPPGRNAEITVHALGENRKDVLFALKELGQYSLLQLRQFTHALPHTAPLPALEYSRTNPYVERLRRAGCHFEIHSYSWQCPIEMRDDHHWCTPGCSVVQVREVVT